MAGTQSGAEQARDTIYDKYGANFYRIQGAKGGAKSRYGGFYNNPELASRAGKIGGAISRRGDNPKPSKHQISEIRKRLLEEQSQMQTSKLSEKYGAKRPW